MEKFKVIISTQYNRIRLYWVLADLQTLLITTALPLFTASSGEIAATGCFGVPV